MHQINVTFSLTDSTTYPSNQNHIPSPKPHPRIKPKLSSLNARSPSPQYPAIQKPLYPQVLCTECKSHKSSLLATPYILIRHHLSKSHSQTNHLHKIPHSPLSTSAHSPNRRRNPTHHQSSLTPATSDSSADTNPHPILIRQKSSKDEPDEVIYTLRSREMNNVIGEVVSKSSIPPTTSL